MTKITFIGAGNMATSIIGGLINQGYASQSITASDPNTEALSKLRDEFQIDTQPNNQLACTEADIIVLAVKPQVMKGVAQELASAVAHQPLVISIAAGINSALLSQWLGNNLPIVRCMPNTPALVQMGASGLYANNKVLDSQKSQAEALLNTIGISIWLDDEALIDTVTAVSGSGPAYFFLLMEAMITTGISQGLSQEQASQLTLQTAAGAAKLALSSNVSVSELRRRVTSPGGTTEKALKSFQQSGFVESIDNAMVACVQRSQEMAEEFG